MQAIFIILIYSFTAFKLFATPAPCEPLSLSQDIIHLKTNKPLHFIFHNTSMHNVFIVPAQTSSATPGWSSMIEPDKWSTLYLATSPLVLKCIESFPGHEQIVSCQSVVTLCKMKAPTQESEKVKWLSANRDVL